MLPGHNAGCSQPGTWERMLIVCSPGLDCLQAVVIQRPPATNVLVWHPHLFHLHLPLLHSSGAQAIAMAWCMPGFMPLSTQHIFSTDQLLLKAVCSELHSPEAEDLRHARC